MAFAIQDLHQVLERCIHVDGAHIHSRGHDFAHRGFHEVENIEDHLLFLLFETFLLAVCHIGKVRLHGVAHFFGQETQLGIVPEQVEQLDENHMAELCRRHERKPHQPEQRNKNYRQRIWLEACHQVWDKHGKHVQHGPRNDEVCCHRYVGVHLHQLDIGIPEHEKPENAGAYVAENAPDGHALVKAVPLHEGRNLFFAFVPLLGVSLCKYKAERALGRREHRRGENEHAKEDNRKYFGIFHHLPSLYRSSPKNSHSRLRITLRSAALMWS